MSTFRWLDIEATGPGTATANIQRVATASDPVIVIRDMLHGDARDEISGDDGNDRFCGNAGDDVNETGIGRNHVWGGGGVDAITYHWASDEVGTRVRVNGGNGDDVIEGANVAWGGGGDDVITDPHYVSDRAVCAYGGAGNDLITGTYQENVLRGGAGNDLLAGGAGRDTFRFSFGDWSDVWAYHAPTIEDFELGIDKITVRNQEDPDYPDPAPDAALIARGDGVTVDPMVEDILLVEIVGGVGLTCDDIAFEPFDYYA